ncbi:putative membrane protein [Selenomonas sp. oral taxon 892 str. F0426]|uniref:DMT family transporter n=1 Tax=Selenomonas sp. oral taxon 892 TaxID=1321785 RepID=UPI0003AD57EB|nr:DMT family transporter [Selenomonas sp. oral taxon 892]ERJ95263.1 putative membrane protein [Selenomonas sp. oral taxon 892 str. F0426]
MSHLSAVLLVLLAGTMWAASGTAAQHFYTQSEHIPLELTQVRLFLSSGLFFLLAWWSGGLRRGVRSLRKNPRLLLQLAIHGIVGIMIVQFTYFMGIAEGDAAATTVIGYTSPAMMILYFSVRYRRLPSAVEAGTVIVAVAGVFLLVTGGDIGRLSVPMACIVWSLLSGVTFTFAMIYPLHLLRLFDRFFLLAVCMLIGAVSLLPMTQVITEVGSFFTAGTWLDLFVIIGLGTVVAFFAFNLGLRWLSPEETAITATIEPVASVIFAWMIFDTHFVVMQIVGIVLVLAAILAPNVLRKWGHT